MYLILLGVVLILLSWLTLSVKRRFSFWSNQGIKGPGVLEWCRRFFMPYQDFCLEMVRKYGRVHGAYALTTQSLVLNDPDLIREVYLKRSGEFTDRVNWNVNSFMLNKMLPFLHGDSKWKRIRNSITPIFTSKKLKGMMTKIVLNSDKFANHLEKIGSKGKIQMDDQVKAFTMDSICICAYGVDPDSINHPNHPFVKNLERITSKDATFSRIVSMVFPKLAKYFNLDLFDSNGIQYFAEQAEVIIDKTQINQDCKAENLIQLMTEANRGASSNPECLITKDEIIAQTIMFFLAGAETTSTSINHLIYYLAKNKDCQQKLYQELKDVDQSSYENIIQLKYLNAVISETLRLAPPFLFLPRLSVNDTEINGMKIPAGTQIEVYTYALHRDPEYWQDPLEFKPERFLEPIHNPWAYQPFGSGPRNCLAERFALNQIRICCAKLFTKFEFSLPQGFEPGYFNGHVLLIMRKLEVELKPRN